MPIDLSTLFQPTPFPQHPIAQFLQIAYQSRESRRRRTEEEAEKKRREELYQLQLGSARRESQQAEEQARVDAMPAGQFAAAQGLRVTPGLETKTIGELRRANLLATAFERVDPRAEAQQRISGSEMLAKTFGIPSPVYGEDIRAATGYQGPLPNVPARPSLTPAPGQGVASTPLEEGVMLGAREERMVTVPGLGRMPVSEAVKIVGTEGLRRITGVEPTPEKPKTIPVTINGRTYNVSEAQAATLASQMQRDRPGQMVTVKDPVSGQTVTIPATSLPSFFPRRAPGAGGVSGLEGLSPSQKRIIDQYNRIGSLAEKAQDKLDDPMMMGDSPQAQSLRKRIEAYKKQQAAVLKRYPWIGRYVGEELEPAVPGAGGTTTSEVQQAARQGVPWESVAAALKQDGIDPTPLRAIYDQARGGGVPTGAGGVGPVRTTAGLSEFVTSRAKTMDWSAVRILLMRELVGRGYTPQEAAKIAETHGRPLYNQARSTRGR